MEPLALAYPFSSIVGMIGLFKSERRADESQTIQQYTERLRRHDHVQLVNAIADNAQLANSIQTLLQQQPDSLTLTGTRIGRGSYALIAADAPFSQMLIRVNVSGYKPASSVF